MTDENNHKKIKDMTKKELIDWQYQLLNNYEKNEKEWEEE
jgi:hypothetical protein